MSKPAGYLSFCLFVALVAPAVLAQPVRGEFPDTLWAHTFGGDASDVGFSIERTPDGGFVVAGYATLYETGEDGYLIRLTAEADPQPLRGSALVNFCHPFSMPFNTGIEYMEDALDTMIEEVRVEVAAGPVP